MIRRIQTIAASTWTELIRLKVFYFLVIFALLVIASSFFLAGFSFEAEFQMLKDIALGAMSIFSALLAILAAANLLPKDMEDRTIYTILAKPVARFEYLLGKLIGLMLLLTLAVALMSLVFAVTLLLFTNYKVHLSLAEMAGAPPAEIASAVAAIKAQGYDANLFSGGAIILLKSWLLAAMTLLISTFSTSAIFTTMASFAVYFIGHLQATARDYWLSSADPGWFVKGALAIIALVFPDLQALNLVDDIVAGATIPLVVLAKTLALGFGYIVVYTALAIAAFQTREL